jgi:MscS family membrane protein
MPKEILTGPFLGNTGEAWLIALFLAIGSVVGAKVVYWIFARISRRLARRTKTALDDIILDMLEEPIAVMLSFLGIRFALGTLSFPDGLETWIGYVFNVVMILAAAWLISRLFDALFKQYVVAWAEESDTDLDDQLLPIVHKMANVVIWSVALIIALDNAGYDVGALVAGLGIGGLAFAMAAKDTIANIFGGFTIFTDKPLTLNDRVRIAGYDGSVREIGLRSTRIETLDGTVVTVPNSKFADSPVENVSLEPSRKVIVKLGLVYDTTPEEMDKAIELLKGIAGGNPNLEEKVLVSFTEFGDFSLNLLLIYYIKKGADILETQSAINRAILAQFNENGLEFAFPTQTLYTKNG